MSKSTNSPIEQLRASLANEPEVWSRPLRLLAEALLTHCDAGCPNRSMIQVGTASGPGHVGPVFAAGLPPMFEPPNAPTQVFAESATILPPGVRRQVFGGNQ